MKTHRFLRSLRRPYPGLTVGIGNYDGVHLGHRRVLRKLRALAGEKGTVGVITFTPHTRSLVSGREESLLLAVGDRLRRLEKEGVDVCWLVGFNRRLAGMSPRRFVEEVLVDDLKIKAIAVGAGYRFGRGARGDVRLLGRLGRELGFAVKEVPWARSGGRRISSSEIRRAVRSGDLRRAEKMLGSPYCLTGRVIKGEGRGSALGYPTANFQPDQLVPAPGVYAAWIGFGGAVRPGLLYLGSAPTFASGRGRPLAEAYVFGWKESLYGRRINVCLNKRLRKDIKFKNVESLLARIREDEKAARRILKSFPAGFSLKPSAFNLQPST